MRDATRYDMSELWEMMVSYAGESPQKLPPELFDRAHVEHVFFQLMAGRGFVLIDEGKGFIAAGIVNNFWVPRFYELKELAWWVKPDYRKSTVGGRLWSEFNFRANLMMEQGRVQSVSTSVMSNSPSINYEKRGFQFLEKTYFRT